MTRSYISRSTRRSNGWTDTSMWSHMGASGGDAARSACTRNIGVSRRRRAFAFEGLSGSHRESTGRGADALRGGASFSPRAAFARALFGGISSANSAHTNFVMPLESVCRSRERVSLDIFAARNARPPARITHRNVSTASESFIAGLRRLGRTSASADATADATADSASSAARSSAATAAKTRRGRKASSGVPPGGVFVPPSRRLPSRDHPRPSARDHPANARASASAASFRAATARHLAILYAANGPATTAAEARSSPSTRERPSAARSAAAAAEGRGGGSSNCARNTEPMTSTSAAN